MVPYPLKYCVAIDVSATGVMLSAAKHLVFSEILESKILRLCLRMTSATQSLAGKRLNEGA
jgi:hypothetical protein